MYHDSTCSSISQWLDDTLRRAVAVDPSQRFETAEEWLLTLEQGERLASNTATLPLLEREPLKVWRGLALISLLLNLVLVVWLAKGS